METSKNITHGYNPRVAWLALIGGAAIYFVNSAAQYKIPPIMLELNQALGLTLSESAWLMSVMSLFGLILALPAGGIIMKLGVKWTTVIAAGFQLVGSLIGTFATGFELMLVSRALEGVALGLCNVVSFAVVTSFFPAEKRGVPNSCITALFTISVFMMMNVAVPLDISFGWQGIWWFVNILSVLAVLAALFLIPSKDKEVNFDDDAEVSDLKEKINYKKLLSTPAIWILPLVFIAFNIGYYGISTYMPTYLVEGVGADQATANFAVSWNSLVGLPAALIIGVVLNKVKIEHRKYVTAVTMFALAVCYFVAFGMPTVESAAFLLIFMGFICTFVPISLYTIGPDVIPSAAYAAIILAIVTFGQNLGMTLGPLVVGYIVDAAGTFAACSMPLAVIAVIGGLIMFFVKVKKA
ncbi:MFS transporter [Raoultibacter phocaeensis]|uniref:MFS transporter n=1 Tax=Raoultibacter phocaeensis TaxID=2479841 RepID=UPI00111936BC|nr:MFS transporter [Raoultibacter phocaeensis]